MSSNRWLSFSVTALLVAATANGLYGIVGLTGNDHFVSDDLIFGGVTFWGGVNLVIGMIQAMIAVLIWKRIPSGVPLGILITGINAVAQTMAIGAYPIWSVTVLAIDIAIIYALAVQFPREAA